MIVSPGRALEHPPRPTRSPTRTGRSIQSSQAPTSSEPHWSSSFRQPARGWRAAGRASCHRGRWRRYPPGRSARETVPVGPWRLAARGLGVRSSPGLQPPHHGGPVRRPRIEMLEVAHPPHHDELAGIARRPRARGVATRDGDRHDVVSVAMHEQLGSRAGGARSVRRGRSAPGACRGATGEGTHPVARQPEPVRLAQIDHGGLRDDARQPDPRLGAGHAGGRPAREAAQNAS